MTVRTTTRPGAPTRPGDAPEQGVRPAPVDAGPPAFGDEHAVARALAPARPARRTETPAPAGTRPSRPAGRARLTRPGGRREAPVLAPVRPVVGGGCGGAAAPSVVVLRRRRAAAVVVLVALLGAVLAVGVALGVPGAGAGSAGPAAPVGAGSAVVVVPAGASLTEVARRAVPGADVDAVVERIRELNGLASSGVEAGRPLLVPTP